MIKDGNFLSNHLGSKTCSACFGRHVAWRLSGWGRECWLVLGSPVQSGFSSIFDKTGTETGPPFLKFSKTETGTVIDRSTAVSCGFLRLQDQSTTSPRPVLYVVVYEIITFFLSTLINTPVHCTYCWCGLCSMVWLHSWSWWVRWLSSMGRIWNDRLTFEMTGPHVKWRAHVRNDRLACEMRGSRSKRRACMWDEGLMLETTGSRAKWRAHIWNDRLACKMTGSCSKQQACMRNEGSRSKQRARMWDEGLMFEMTGSRAKWWAHVRNDGPACEMTGSCSKWHALVGVGGVHRHHVGPNATLSSGGGHEGKWGNRETSCLRFASSRTWWVSDSMHLLLHLSTPSQTPISH